MLLHSTAESVDKGEISLLAIVETILATAIAIYLSVKFDSLKWIAWTACVAPFFLLRTQDSIKLGFKLFLKIGYQFTDRIEKPRNEIRKAENWVNLIKSIGGQILLTCSLVIGVALIRFVSVLFTCCRHPFISISSIPANWCRAALYMDFCHPLELIPGYPYKTGDGRFTVSGYFMTMLSDISWRKTSQWKLLLFLIPFMMPVVIVWFAPLLLYRWSMTATAIVYTPLLWIVWSSFRKMPDIAAALRRKRQSDLTRVVVFYSILVITGFAIKFILMVKWSQFAGWWNMTPLTEFFAIYVVPAEIPPWQVAALINAFWAIGLFGYAKEALMRVDTSEAWPPTVVESVLRVSSFGTKVLTLYTVACTGYLTVQAATSWNLPKLGTKLFPWMN